VKKANTVGVKFQKELMEDDWMREENKEAVL